MMIDPQTLNIKLTDFGFAIDKSSAPAEIVGHLSAFPPEQLAALSLVKSIDLDECFSLIGNRIANPLYLSKFITQTYSHIKKYKTELSLSGKMPSFNSGKQLDIFALGRLFEESIRLMKQTTGISTELKNKLELLYSDIINPNPDQRLTDANIILKRLLDLKYKFTVNPNAAISPETCLYHSNSSDKKAIESSASPKAMRGI